MHPELLRALANARHEDLLSGSGNRGLTRVHLEAKPRFARSRRRVGSLLMWAGARLIGDRLVALELAHK